MLRDLVLAECAEGRGRFLKKIADGIWLICEESGWSDAPSPHMRTPGYELPDKSKPELDLTSGETVNLLACTSYLLAEELDTVSINLRKRILLEARERVLDPCLQRDDMWWMGFQPAHTMNNWNPWCNSNWLTAVLLLETDPGRRVASVHKILRSLDQFIGYYSTDGACDEGPHYWGFSGATLFNCLDLLNSASRGAIDVFQDGMIKNIGKYIYRVHIDSLYFFNYADAPLFTDFDEQGDDMMFRYGKKIGDPNLVALGAYLAGIRMANGPSVAGNMAQRLAALQDLNELYAARRSTPPFVRDVWLEGTMEMVARSKGGSPEGFYLAARGGYNDWSHSHNDVGNFIVYYNGKPVFIDVGSATTNIKTYGEERYTLWNLQSAYHNLPTVNGVMQYEDHSQFVPGHSRNEKGYWAKDPHYSATGSYARFGCDISAAYPPSAKLKSWRRTVSLDRKKQITVTDDYELAEKTGEVFLSLMTPCRVELEKDGLISLEVWDAGEAGKSAALKLRYDPKQLSAKVEEIDLDDPRLEGFWKQGLRRIVLKVPADSPLRNSLGVRITR
ncbi:heparinase II/III-family protein [bacterium]|nr:heparinase II/III-family protein [bacterium]